MSKRTRSVINVVALGIILANFVVASSRTFESFAPLSMSSTWLYAASFVCGLVLGSTVDEALTIFYGVFVMALIAVLIFSAIMMLTALLNSSPFLDIILLFAMQQSFPRFVFICVLGYVGAFFPPLLKTLFGRL